MKRGTIQYVGRQQRNLPPSWALPTAFPPQAEFQRAYQGKHDPYHQVNKNHPLLKGRIERPGHRFRAFPFAALVLRRKT